jgi:sugar phosphate permease
LILTIVLPGYNFGSAVVNFLGGVLVDLINWKAVFHVPAIMGVIWCVAWKFLMYDRPEQHPRISINEREFLTSMTGTLKAGLKVR